MKTLSLGLAILLGSNLCAQNRHQLSGYVEDAETGERLPGVSIYVPKTQQSTSTNTYGFYSLSLPAQDSLEVHFAMLGLQSQQIKLFLQKDSSLTLALGSENLDEVEVVARQERSQDQVQMSQIELSAQQIKALPAFLGEVDVLKVLQLLPGVQSGEGNSGLYIRGGSPDQNLILLDGVPVYNVYHLFGFFSVFNADAIKNVQLTKGGYPARYGGRLAAVVDIQLKEGNNKKFQGEGSIGLISSKLTFEGPIKKGQTSFIVSARRTYIDVLARPFIYLAQAAQGSDERLIPGYYFYDLNAKINHRINNKHHIFLSTYLGRDAFTVSYRANQSFSGGRRETRMNYSLDWGNLTSALRWNYLISNRLFANTTLTYSRYHFNVRSEISERDFFDNGQTRRNDFAALYRSGIEDWGLKTDFDYLPDPKHHIRFGWGGIYHQFKPGALTIRGNDSDLDSSFNTRTGNEIIPAGEFYAYAEDDWRISRQLRANLGLHASGFAVQGRWYQSLQPRLALRQLLPKDIALKASFATMTQFIHMLTNEGVGLPTDLWVPTTANVAPEQSWQAALGLAKTFGEQDEYEFSIEGYYRDMRQLISYRPGASFIEPGSQWENKIESGGLGQSYGAELYFQKKLGAFTGWLSYTLSWNWRQFPDSDINNGQRYPFKYDRRHNLALTGVYQFNPRLSASAVWVYGTGNAITLPVERYLIPDENGWYREVEDYGSKNNFRMAPYHRLDLSLDWHTQREKWAYSWSFGAYNVYNRQNPFFIFSGNDPATGQRVFRQVALFPFIPSIRWNFKF